MRTKPPEIPPNQVASIKLDYRDASLFCGEPKDSFERMVVEFCGDSAEHGYYTTLAGPSFPNADGSSRIKAIGGCKVGDLLLLQHERDNPYGANAVAVKREDGAQLGYLPHRSASEAVHAFEEGHRFMAFFRHKNHHPETHHVVGAVIFLVRMKIAPPETKVTAPQ
ncbi:MAG: HIRAN domain-containing protein [Terriglobia bacterium]|nr:HIRAN domain-containing protein [Terriglobia bacterium]